MPRALVLARQLDRRMERSSLFYGSDADGFGIDAAKKKLIEEKRRRKTDQASGGENSQDSQQAKPELPLFYGNDNTPPPEQPTVPDPAPAPAPTATDSKPAATQTIEVPTVPDPASADILTIKRSEYQGFIDQAAQQAIAPALAKYKEQITAMSASQDAQQQQFNQIVADLNKQLQEVSAESDRKTKILEANGSSIPLSSDRTANGAIGGSFAVNYLSFGTSKELQNTAKDFADFCGNPAYVRQAQGMDEYGGLYTARDHRKIDQFVKQNRDELRRDMEIYAKGNGLLRGIGADAFQSGNTLGQAGSIPDAFINYLSSEMRMAKSTKYIWWQFTNAALGLGTPVGSTVLVPKFENMNEPQTEADYVLEELNVYEAASADSQALIMNTVPVQIKGYGLGKNTVAGGDRANLPVAIPEFIQVTSLVELMSVLNRKLTRNYNGFMDMMIRGKYREARRNANNVFYNVSGSAANAVGAAAGSDGTMTEAFLNEMFARMTDADVPALEDGRRVAILSNKSASQLKTDLGDKWQAPTPTNLQDLTNILNATYPGSDIDNVSGYMGDYEGFHCFLNLSSSRGAAGSEGVYLGNAVETGAATVDLGADFAAVTYRDNFFFGPDAVAKGTAMPMEIRMDPSTSFGRMFRFIWREIAGYGAIAVSSLAADGTTATNQEDCVFIGRTCDTVL